MIIIMWEHHLNWPTDKYLPNREACSAVLRLIVKVSLVLNSAGHRPRGAGIFEQLSNQCRSNYYFRTTVRRTIRARTTLFNSSYLCLSEHTASSHSSHSLSCFASIFHLPLAWWEPYILTFRLVFSSFLSICEMLAHRLRSFFPPKEWLAPENKLLMQVNLKAKELR